MITRLRFQLAATWLWLRRETHGFDLTREPEGQRRLRWRILRAVRSMEYDPHTQWRYHLVMSWVWIASAAPILVLFFFFPTHWLNWGLLITLLYSLYANWVSDFTGLHAAWAALRGDQIAQRQDIIAAEQSIVEEIRGDGGEESLETLHKLYLESLDKLARIEAALQRRSYRGKKNGKNGEQDHVG